MGIQPQNAMTALGYLNSIGALGKTPTPRAPGTAFDGGWDPGAERRKRNAEIWGSAQVGAPNYNKYMDKSNRDNYSPDGAWRGYTPHVDTLSQRAMFGLGGTGPSAATVAQDKRRAEQKKEWNDIQRKSAMRRGGMQLGGAVGDAYAALRNRQMGNPNQTPGIFVPGQEPAPSPGETPSDNSIPTPPTTKPIEPGGLGGMPPSTPIGPSNNTSGNPLMNTMKPKQKPKFGTLGATSGFMPVSDAVQKQYPGRWW